MRLHGSKGQVLMDAAPPALPAPPVPVLVASLNAFTIDMARDRVDTTSFGDLNKQYVQGLPDYKGTLGGFLDPASPGGNLALFEIALGDVPAFLKLVPSTLAATVFFSGLAYIDASVKVSATGAVTMDGSWVAAGPWALDQPA